MRPSKLLLVVMSVTSLVAVMTGSAVARQLELSERDLRATFPRWEISNAFGTAKCELTLEMTMHERRITKTAELLIGFVTRAAITACAMGTANLQIETLPWHIRYESFTGTLPNITRLNTRVIGMAWNIREPIFGVMCLIRTSAGEPARLIFSREAGSVLTEATLGGEIASGPECMGIRTRIAGTTNSLTVLERVERVRLRLI